MASFRAPFVLEEWNLSKLSRMAQSSQPFYTNRLPAPRRPGPTSYMYLISVAVTP